MKKRAILVPCKTMSLTDVIDQRVLPAVANS